jgi:hypothetical protein
MTLLQNVRPFPCEEASQHVQVMMGGNHERHMPMLSKPRPWLEHTLQYSRHVSYSLAETPRLTTW